MAEVLVDFGTDVVSGATTYRPRAIGRLAADGMWEGWLEFAPVGGGEPLISHVESRQPEREHLIYWATGLSPIYLEGAFERAMKQPAVHLHVIEEPLSDAPAERAVSHTVVAPYPEAVLDPFEIGSRSLDVLQQELTALNRPRLFNIIAAFGLNPGGEALDWMTDHQLVTFIVTAVDAQLVQRGR
jgi:hypothetical protein